MTFAAINATNQPVKKAARKKTVKPLESQIEASIDSSHDPQRNGGEKTPVLAGEVAPARELRPWQQAFVKHLADCGIISEACRRAKINRQIVRDWRGKDPVFNQAVIEAHEDITDQIEGTAIELAIKGVERPVYSRGEKVDSVREHDTSFLQFMLKTRRREVYGERLDVSVTSLNAHVHFDAKQLVAEFDRLIPALAGSMVEPETMAGNGQKESAK